MEQVIERCAGLDVHKATVAACVRVATAGHTRRQEIRTFGTSTADLLEMRDWLSTHGVTHIAMEATGVYWKPIYYVLEDDFTLLLVNAAHVKQVPGRKTDVADCAVVGAAPGTWLIALKLRSTPTNPRSARSQPVTQMSDPGMHPRSQPPA